MKFFSGFSLQNESYLFEKYIHKSEFTVVGFSYGAIKALEYVKEQLACGNRVDTLQLLSPAFFQTKDEKFKRLQLMAYRKNEEVYLRQFINSCFYPHGAKIVQHSTTVLDELDELLHYEWDSDAIQEILDKGIVLEVYLGTQDAIIDAQGAREFFVDLASVTYIKNANHFLQTN